MTFKEKCSEIKDRIVAKTNSAINYCKENPVVILEGGAILLLSGLSVHQILSNKDLKKMNSALNRKCHTLTKENLILRIENAISTNRNNELIELCNQMDKVMAKTMSDGLRHGSPVAAQQMAYKRQYDLGR